MKIGRNKKCYLFLIISFILLTVGCNSNNVEDKNGDSKVIEKSDVNTSNEEMETMKVIINENDYVINLESNETVKSFINLLPLELNMSELNGNEKFFYLDESLPNNSTNPKHINAGDVMLYGNNCLVIFYKSFDTSYSYTKIGHIDNLDDLGSGSIKVKIEK